MNSPALKRIFIYCVRMVTASSINWSNVKKHMDPEGESECESRFVLDRYRPGGGLARYWDCLELVDVQYADPATGYTRWGPWVLHSEK